MKFLARALAALFELWHKLISPALGHSCRHEPSCSQYGALALRRHGLFKGLWLTLKRLARCQPWGSFGYDPVPEVR